MSGIKGTLTEILITNFFETKKKKINQDGKKPNSLFSLSAILINSHIQEVKGKKTKNAKNKDTLEEETKEETKIDNKKEKLVNGGYGTVNKLYRFSPIVKYTDYNKIWGHLGRFITYSMYGDIEGENNITIKDGESSRQMVSTETIEKAAKHFKYFVVGEILGDIGFVPPVGLNIDSKEWEKYRLMSIMSIYQPLLRLKWTTA